MDEPIISIYDMLVMRRKQQQQQQMDLTQNRDTHSKSGSEHNTQTKKFLQHKTRSKMSEEIKLKPGWRMATNVVTATHITQKWSTILTPPPGKKEVVNQLVETMAGKRPKKKPIASTLESAEHSERTPTLPRKLKKLKCNKSSRGSASSKSCMRLALSPRNKNASIKPKVKREAFLKAKAFIEPKLPRSKDPDAIKAHQVGRQTKNSSNASKSTRVDNAARYRI
ncbi:uncharacterized protein LOC6562670 [Drosophila grimshawi]|uniref:GH11270 n=1 Tax=Drosophila grimshawi TaxID=7222 RepID=B4JDY1_DROGR|nr:uncharacterized protein LOC6562670 [Drosophila grimshawi]EDW03501.1 GH11270 [Drosophila grimshawi]